MLVNELQGETYIVEHQLKCIMNDTIITWSNESKSQLHFGSFYLLFTE